LELDVLRFFRIYSLALTVLGAFMWEEVTAQNSSETQKDNEYMLVDFKDTVEIQNWWIVNDGVMGGISSSEMIAGDSGNVLFQGVVSLENNGGFASVRTRFSANKLDEYSGILIRVRGDGKKYQFRIRTTNRFDGVSYRYIFNTEEETWQEIFMPFNEFVPVFRGRILRDVGPLDPDQIRQLGILIADKQAGRFQLEIDWIAAQK
jgi:monofunctional biosynthetic peptidoglycan transglycosylase